MEQIAAAADVLRGHRLEWRQLFGGLAHVTYAVVDATPAQRYVVKFLTQEMDDFGLMIPIADLIANTVAAGESGVGARVVQALPEMPALVLEYIDGRTLDTPDLAQADYIPRIGRGHPRPARQGAADAERHRDLEVPRGLPGPDRQARAGLPGRDPGLAADRAPDRDRARGERAAARAQQQRPAGQERHGRRPDPDHRLRLQRHERPDVRRRRPGHGGRLRPGPDPGGLHRLLRRARPGPVRPGPPVRHRGPVHLVAAVRRHGRAADRLARRGLRLLAGGLVALGLDQGQARGPVAGVADRRGQRCSAGYRRG